jgi:alkylation response protein AidB-like acyl-CoA dehydrogenase
MSASQPYLDRAKKLVPILAERAAVTEQRRQVLPETIADIKAAGFHRMAQPKRYGGAEVPLDEIAQVIATLARGCTSSSWVTGLLNDHSIILSKFDSRALDDVWAKTPDALVCAGYIPAGTVEKAPGGYRIAGKWGFASGCDHADWLLVGSMLPTGGDHPMPSLCLVPRSEVEIEDNWHFLGLAGTGSKNLVIKSAIVPEYRTLPLPKNNTGTPPGDTSAPFLSHLPHAATVPFLFCANGIGLAESLLDLIVEQMKSRSAALGQPLVELQSLHLHIAEAAAEIDSARLLMERDLSAAMAAMRSGRELTLAEKARNRRDQAYIAKICRRAVDRLFGTVGAKGMYLDQVAQRKFRDMCAVSAHIITSWDMAGTTYGRVALGLDPATFLI